MEGDKMTEMMMTAQELAEVRALESKATAGPWDDDGSGFINGPDGRALAQMWDKFEDDFPNSENNRRFIAAARTLVPRLLATVDALTERAERAEEVRPDAEVSADYWYQVHRKAEQERDEALAALRQQQEREAELTAMIGALRGALERVMREAEGPSGGCPMCGNDGGHHKGCSIEPIFDLLQITPPQALREREERVGALEKRADMAELERDAMLKTQGRIEHALCGILSGEYGWDGEDIDHFVNLFRFYLIQPEPRTLEQIAADVERARDFLMAAVAQEKLNRTKKGTQP